MKLFTKRGMAVGLVAGAMSVAALALPSGAAATTTVAGPPGCVATISSDGHSATVKCAGITNHGAAYQVTAKTCSVSGCSTIGSGTTLVAYGTTVKLSGGSGYIASNSFVYKWGNATNSPNTQWCSFTALGGKVAWCDMQASIRDWSDRGIPYNESSGDTTWNWYHDRLYRPDCGGLADMAWHMGKTSSGVDISPNTNTIKNYSKSVTLSYGAAGTHVTAGDVLIDYLDPAGKNPGHAVVFAGWDANHVTFSVWSFGDGYMGPSHLFTGERFGSGSIGGWPATHYKNGYRYNNATGTSWG